MFADMMYLAAGSMFVYMVIVFIIATIIKNNSIADIAWGGGFILTALVSFLNTPEQGLRQIITTVLVITWGTRLALHIYFRNKGRGEDPRYKKWRDEWGNLAVVKAFFQVFMLQGALLLAVASPIVYINSVYRPGPVITDYIGIFIWALGFITETVADKQLKNFKNDPDSSGKIMDRGLWNYSRHPNYFGEALTWWGIYVITLSLPGGWKFIFSPILITYLLRYVSGVPLLEEHMEGRPGFEEYKERTPVFIPWLPKNKGEER